MKSGRRDLSWGGVRQKREFDKKKKYLFQQKGEGRQVRRTLRGGGGGEKNQTINGAMRRKTLTIRGRKKFQKDLLCGFEKKNKYGNQSVLHGGYNIIHKKVPGGKRGIGFTSRRGLQRRGTVQRGKNTLLTSKKKM